MTVFLTRSPVGRRGGEGAASCGISGPWADRDPMAPQVGSDSQLQSKSGGFMSLLAPGYWPELGQMAPPSCKGSWEM